MKPVMEREGQKWHSFTSGPTPGHIIITSLASNAWRPKLAGGHCPNRSQIARPPPHCAPAFAARNSRLWDWVDAASQRL